MRRAALLVAAGVLVTSVFIATNRSVVAADPAGDAIVCHGIGAHIGRLYRSLVDRQPDTGGLAYWAGHRLDGASGTDGDPGHSTWPGLVAEQARNRVTTWFTRSDELARIRPYREPSMCTKIAQFDLTEVRPGIAVGRTGSTVTVVADRALVEYRVTSGDRTSAERVLGDVVVNANWFTAAGSVGPVVADGHLSGSADSTERGQVIARSEACDGEARRGHLRHVWTGEIYHHDPCVLAAVSGISLVHKGLRADAYTGFDITSGYTNTSRSHSFIGFNGTEIIIVATTEMNASTLADYAISLGVDEGIMLDGGGSTQIATPTVALTSRRPVPTFAVLESRH